MLSLLEGNGWGGLSFREKAFISSIPLSVNDSNPLEMLINAVNHL